MEGEEETIVAASSSDEEEKTLKKEEKKPKKTKCKRKRCGCSIYGQYSRYFLHRLLTINVTNCKYDSGKYWLGWN